MKLRQSTPQVHPDPLTNARLADLESAVERLVEAFELCDAPTVDLEQDADAVLLRLRTRVAYVALLVRGTCHCTRFELPKCICTGRGVH